MEKTTNAITNNTTVKPMGILDNILKNKLAILMTVVVIALSVVVWMVYKKTKKMQKSIREQQKSANEITNLKYGLQDTVNVVNDMRTRLSTQEPKRKQNNVPQPAPEKMRSIPQEMMGYEILPKSQKIEIESIFSEDVDGESEDDENIIELEEETDSEEED